MEGFLFLFDMFLLILLLAALIKAEKAGKQYIDSGVFRFYRDSEAEPDKRGKQPSA